MLVIRDAQLRAFEDAAIERIVPQVEAFVRQHHAARVDGVPPDVVRRRVRTAIRRAMHYRLRGDAFALLVALMFEIAPNVDAHPAFRAILADTGASSDLRYRLLVEGITRQDVNEARAAADDAAWSVSP